MTETVNKVGLILVNQREIFLYVVCVSLALAGGITFEWRAQATILRDLVVFTWLLGFVNLIYLGGTLNRFGVRPRTTFGLLGIFFAPFLHGNGEHLMFNTLPFLILGWLVLLQGTSEFYVVTVFTALVSGAGIWLFGRANSSHIGASGVIFGYLGFLLMRGYFTQDWRLMLPSFIVAVIYGRLIKGILPLQEGISWEGHLFGLIGGILAARFLDELGFFEVFKAIFPEL
ncbi:rhomboid family intramembrane serine protease [Lyngbya aestuarii]|uniref:rhomboid family intramembrane serine protease n=1 Tax=Lyngbya aestuarii TaxID=118322 RepID=UPI00403E2268